MIKCVKQLGRHYATANYIEDEPDINHPQCQKEVRNALRALGVLTQVHGNTRAMLLEVNPKECQQVGEALIQIAHAAKQQQQDEQNYVESLREHSK